MIYPSSFPSNIDNYPEKRVYDCLKKVSDKYDIFYSRRFISAVEEEKVEYEIDFIVALPNECILVLEVKGGIIEYNGEKNLWIQSGRKLNKNPIQQVTSASHSLVRRYPNLSSKVPFGWGLVFPESELPSHLSTPTNISRDQIIDEKDLLNIDESISKAINFWKKKYPVKNGARHYEYSNFKESILRGIGLVKKLATKIRYDEQSIIKLSDRQVEIFHRALGNKKMIVNGVAGSGKTLIAKSLTAEFTEAGKESLMLCYNKTLAKKLQYDTNSKYQTNLNVSSFHSFARRTIEQVDVSWWDDQVKDDDFWEIEIAVKLDEVSSELKLQFDVLIIDEAQDFKDLWVESLLKFTHVKSRIYLFTDQDQDLFERRLSDLEQLGFAQYNLDENCRNTQNIIGLLNKHSSKTIKHFDESPRGDDVKELNFKSEDELCEGLVSEIQNLTSESGLNNDQITVLLNGIKSESAVKNITKIGKFDFRSLAQNGRYFDNTIHFTTINVFKGLESDVIFLINPNRENSQRFYTECSRAKHKLIILSSK